MFLDGLDDLDQKIIRCLIQNARMPYSEIGQQVGISRVAVKMRVQALEKKGIIEEYTTIINPQKISGAISCYFEIETVPDTLEEVISILEKNDTVTQIYRVTGKSLASRTCSQSLSGRTGTASSWNDGSSSRRAGVQHKYHFIQSKGHQRSSLISVKEELP